MTTIKNRRCASIKSLTDIKDVTEEDAERIRQIWKGTEDLAYAQIVVNRILQTHGVEYLLTDRRTNREVLYCNAGDVYATTVLFCGNVLFVGCMADAIQTRRVRNADY